MKTYYIITSRSVVFSMWAHKNRHLYTIISKINPFTPSLTKLAKQVRTKIKVFAEIIYSVKSSVQIIRRDKLILESPAITRKLKTLRLIIMIVTEKYFLEILQVLKYKYVKIKRIQK
jgi:hypothetical protein